MPSLYSQFGFGPVASTAIFLTFFFHPASWRQAIWETVMSAGSGIFDTHFQWVVFGSFILHEVVFISLNLVMWVIYRLESPIFEQFKIQQKPWPWKGSAKQREEWVGMVKKAVVQTAVNHLIFQLPLLALSYPTFKAAGFDTDLELLPKQMWVIPVQVLIFMLVEDTLFYWAHRGLHLYFYGAIHKQHHTFKTTVGIASEYAHPIEFVLSNGAPFTAGPVLVGLLAKAMGGTLHLYVFWVWIIVRIGETIDGHCGYEFSWSPYRLLPFSGSAAHHDWHHSHPEKGGSNYGSFFTFWDSAMGTDRPFKLHLEKEAKANKAA